MHRIKVVREMELPALRVWELLDDFSNTWVYHPIVGESGTTNGIERGLGAQRFCRMYGGKTVEERVVSHDAEGMTYRIEVVDHGPFPMEHMAVDVRVESMGRGRSRAVFEAEFVMKYGALGRMMGSVMMERRLGGLLAQVLEGAEDHLRTGLVVGKGGVLEGRMAA